MPPPDTNPNPALRPVQTSVTAAPGMGNISVDLDDDEGLKHLEQVNLPIFIHFWTKIKNLSLFLLFLVYFYNIRLQILN